MTLKLDTEEKVVGTKQVKGMLTKDELQIVYIAKDAEKSIIRDLVDICNEKQVEVMYVESMKKLGEACGIDVNAASAALMK